MRERTQGDFRNSRMLSDREGAQRYGLGVNGFRLFSDSCGAVIRIGRRRLNDVNVLDAAFEELRREQNGGK